MNIIKFKRDVYGDTIDPVTHRIRDTVRQTVNGKIMTMKMVRVWAKNTDNATVNTNDMGEWESISFKTEYDMARFVLKYLGE